MNSYQRRKDRGVVHHGEIGMRSERRTARRLDATLVPLSGGMPTAKSDMVKAEEDAPLDFRIEAKSTMAASYALKLDILAKILREATERQQFPALSVVFTHGDGRPVQSGKWMVIEERTFQTLLAMAKESK